MNDRTVDALVLDTLRLLGNEYAGTLTVTALDETSMTVQGSLVPDERYFPMTCTW